jgi:dipeptidyl-peptidase-4
MRKIFLLLAAMPLYLSAQKKQITLEDIYKKGTFRADYFGGFGSEKTDSLVNTFTVTDVKGKSLGKRDYQLSDDQSKALFSIDREYIYRRSSKAYVYLYNSATRTTTALDTAKILHATFSPDGSKVAYVKDNNLYIYDVASAASKAVTTDGKWNYIINGNCDWVYEEEFEFTRAFQWSEKGTYLAYYRFDESQVKEYNMTVYDKYYNKDYRYKYPKAGEANSTVEIHIYNVQTGADVKAQFETGDIYIPRIRWSKQEDNLVVYWLNRHQDDLKLLNTNAATGASTLLYEEHNKYYVEINDNWWFLKDGRNVLYTSEKSGFTQLYLMGLDTRKETQLTKGNYEITEVNGVDEANKAIYFTAAYPRPMDRTLFTVGFDGKNLVQLTKDTATHNIVFNDNFTQLYDYRSDINTPQVVRLYTVEKGKKPGLILVKTVLDNARLNTLLNNYELGNISFLKVPTSKGDSLNGWMLKPSGFDAGKKYPVLFCNYGGPGSQQVANRFGAVSYWHRMMASKGYIVVCFDNTGTGFRGEAFKKKTYLQLGKYEIEDQIDAAKYLATQPYVDGKRIGHWGWSFGGFMSALAISKGADVFSAAISVAPVTSWRFYDNIYTERYMRTPQENPTGYDDNSPLNHTAKIKGKYLLIHGTADDNVHFQNSVELVDAMVRDNVKFESAYYPNKNHGISGGNTSYHLWSKMTEWLLNNL